MRPNRAAGSGLTRIGTYGPLSRFAAAAAAGTALMVRHGMPPLIVSRPMRGGHYGVLRFITILDKRDPAEVERVRALNRELLTLLAARGFVVHKTPAWAWQASSPQLDPASIETLADAKALVDPAHLFKLGKLGL